MSHECLTSMTTHYYSAIKPPLSDTVLLKKQLQLFLFTNFYELLNKFLNCLQVTTIFLIYNHLYRIFFYMSLILADNGFLALGGFYFEEILILIWYLYIGRMHFSAHCILTIKIISILYVQNMSWNESIFKKKILIYFSKPLSILM